MSKTYEASVASAEAELPSQNAASLLKIRAVNIINIYRELKTNKSASNYEVDTEHNIIQFHGEEEISVIKDGDLYQNDKLVTDEVEISGFANNLFNILRGMVLSAIKSDRKEADESFSKTAAILSIINKADKQSIINQESKKPIIHFAVEKFEHNLVKILLENGANANFLDEKDNTPLHSLALCSKGFEGKTKTLLIAVILLQAGAIVEVVNQEQKTPTNYVDSKLKLCKVMGYNALELSSFRKELEATIKILNEDVVLGEKFQIVNLAEVSSSNSKVDVKKTKSLPPRVAKLTTSKVDNVEKMEPLPPPAVEIIGNIAYLSGDDFRKPSSHSVKNAKKYKPSPLGLSSLKCKD